MGSTEDSPDALDVALLRALFAPGGGGFRHRMGLQRRDFGEFYASTADGEAIRRQKAAVLANDPALYMAVSEEVRPAFGEFAAMLGLLDAPGQSPLGAARSLSLQIEPDFLLLLPPDWMLTWASVCSPSHWSLEGKSRLPLMKFTPWCPD